MKTIKSITDKMKRDIMKETTLSFRVQQSTSLTEEEAQAVVNSLGFSKHAQLSKAIDDLNETAINKIIEDAQGFGSFSSVGKKPTGTQQAKPTPNSNPYAAARATPNTSQNPIDSLNIGDEVEVIGKDGNAVMAKIQNPKSVGNTIQVKTNRGLETVNKDDIKLQQEMDEASELKRMQELAGIEETSAGAVGGMAMPMGQVVKREPSTPKSKSRKKRN